MTATGIDRDLVERISELESGNDDGQSWMLLGDASDFQFSRGFVTSIAKYARIMYLKNPIIQRGVNVKSDYVFGRSVTINSEDPDVNAVLQKFLDDEQNQDQFTGHIARVQRDRELQIDGNIFLVLVPHPVTGHVRIQTISPEEIVDKIGDPTNKARTLFYKREWFNKANPLSPDQKTDGLQTRYYRDYRNRDSKEITIDKQEVDQDVYIYHITGNKFTDWKFAISEIYSGLDWAKAYKNFLENWSTIVAAYARFAWKVTTTKGKQGVASVKARLSTTRTSSTASETNPAPVAGSTVVMDDSTDMIPIKTSGATTSAEDGRRLLLMVAAMFGLPETFFGDVSVGTLATARSLDRPTELMLTNRQELWRDVYHDIAMFVLWCAANAPANELNGSVTIEKNEYQEDVIKFTNPDTTVNVTFPSIIELDPQAEINALVAGATFDGKRPSIIADQKLLARLVLQILNVDDADTVLEQLYPGDGPHLPPEPIDPLQNTLPNGKAIDDLQQASEALRESILKLAESMAMA